VTVKGPRDQLLSRAALSENQNGGICWRYAGDGPVDLLHPGAGADHRPQTGSQRTQLAILFLETPDAEE